MAKNISLKVSFGNNEQLHALAKVKRNIQSAKCAIINEVKPAFQKYMSQTPEIKVEDGEEALYLYGSVDFDGEEALSKEILEMCNALYKKIQEYDALMKFEISKAPAEPDAKE